MKDSSISTNDIQTKTKSLDNGVQFSGKSGDDLSFIATYQGQAYSRRLISPYKQAIQTLLSTLTSPIKAWRARVNPRINLTLEVGAIQLQKMIDYGFIGHKSPSLLTMVRACLGEGRPIHTTDKPIDDSDADKTLDNIIEKLQQRIKALELEERTNSENDTGALTKKLFKMLNEAEEEICNINDNGSFYRFGDALNAINQARKLIQENPTVGFHAGVQLTQRDQLALKGRHLIEADMTPHMFARFLSKVEANKVSEYDIRCAIDKKPLRPMWPFIGGLIILTIGIVVWPILSAAAATMTLGFTSLLIQAAPLMIVLLGLSLFIMSLRSAGLFAKADDYKTNFKQYDRFWSPLNFILRLGRNIWEACKNVKHWHLFSQPTPATFPASTTPATDEVKAAPATDGAKAASATDGAKAASATDGAKAAPVTGSSQSGAQLKTLLEQAGVAVQGSRLTYSASSDPQYTKLIPTFNARPLDERIRQLRIGILQQIIKTSQIYNTATMSQTPGTKATPVTPTKIEEAYIKLLKAQANFEQLLPARADNKRVGLFKHQSFVATTYHIYNSIANVMEEWGKDDPELAVLSLAAWGMMSHYMMAHTVASSSKMHAILPQNKFMDGLAKGIFSGGFTQNHTAISSFLTGFSVGKGTYMLGSLTDRHGFGAKVLTALSKDPVALCAGMLLTMTAGSAFMLPTGAAGEVAANPAGTLLGVSLTSIKPLSIVLSDVAGIYRWSNGLPSIEESRLRTVLSSLQAYAGDKSLGSQYQEIIDNLEKLAKHPALNCKNATQLIADFRTEVSPKAKKDTWFGTLKPWVQSILTLAFILIASPVIILASPFYIGWKIYKHPDPWSIFDNEILLNIVKTFVTALWAPLGIAICNLTGQTDKIKKIPGGKLWQILIDHLINLILRIIQTVVELVGTLFIGLAAFITGLFGTLAWGLTLGNIPDFGTGPAKRFFRSGLHALSLGIEQIKITCSSIADYRREEGEDIYTKTYDSSIIAGSASEQLTLNTVISSLAATTDSKPQICQGIIAKFADHFPRQTDQIMKRFVPGYQTGEKNLVITYKQGLETCTALLKFYQKNIAAGGGVFKADTSGEQDVIDQYITATAGNFVSANPIQRFSQAVLDKVYGRSPSQQNITTDIFKMKQALLNEHALSVESLFKDRVKEISQLQLPLREKHAALLAEMIKAKLLNPKFDIVCSTPLFTGINWTKYQPLSSHIHLVQTADYLAKGQSRQLEKKDKDTSRTPSWKHRFRGLFNCGLFLSVFAGVYAGLNAIIFKAAIVGTICAGTAGVAAVIMLIGLVAWGIVHQQSGGHNNERIPQKEFSQHFQDVAATSDTPLAAGAKQQLGHKRPPTPPTRHQSPKVARPTDAKQFENSQSSKKAEALHTTGKNQPVDPKNQPPTKEPPKTSSAPGTGQKKGSPSCGDALLSLENLSFV